MKASEENVFNACEMLYEKTGKYPTADEIIEVTGGGKKDVLQHKKKWEACRYLTENEFDIPARWVSLLADLHKEIQLDNKAFLSSENEKHTLALQEIQGQLRVSTEDNQNLAKQLKDLGVDLKKALELIEEKDAALESSKKIIDQHKSNEAQLGIEISERSIEIKGLNAQLIQERETKKEELERANTQSHLVAEQLRKESNELKEEVRSLQEKVYELNTQNMVANSEYARIKTENSVLKNQVSDTKKQLSEKSNHLENVEKGKVQVEKELAESVVTASKLPLLEEMNQMLRVNAGEQERLLESLKAENQLYKGNCDFLKNENSDLEKVIEGLTQQTEE